MAGTHGQAKDSVPRRKRGGGLDIGPASCAGDIVDAWELVYRAYLRTGLIDPNPQKVFTNRYAAAPEACVIVGRIDDVPVCTLTTMPEIDGKLPLDRVYPNELAQLRGEGRRLIEAGLFADRREHVTRALPAIIEMMRYVFFSAYHYYDDIIIGVHPHHASFYERYHSFEQIGEATVHPGVNDNPVVPLRLPMKEKMQLNPLPKGLALYAANPIDKAVFEERYRFTHEERQATAVEAFLSGAKGSVAA